MCQIYFVTFFYHSEVKTLLTFYARIYNVFFSFLFKKKVYLKLVLSKYLIVLYKLSQEYDYSNYVDQYSKPSFMLSALSI